MLLCVLIIHTMLATGFWQCTALARACGIPRVRDGSEYPPRAEAKNSRQSRPNVSRLWEIGADSPTGFWQVVGIVYNSIENMLYDFCTIQMLKKSLC